MIVNSSLAFFNRECFLPADPGEVCDKPSNFILSHNSWEHVFENEKYARVETTKICKYRLSLNEKCKNLKILGSEIEIMIFQSFP